MRAIYSILLVGGLVLSLPSMSFGQACSSIKDIDRPFPLGVKAPIPWDKIDGYWTDYSGNNYFYKIEVRRVFRNGSRTVAVQVLDSTGNQIIGNGVGFVRAKSWDLWARVKGLNLDLKLRVQAYLPVDVSDMDQRVLIASIKDMQMDRSQCLVQHALRKVDILEVHNQAPVCTK